MFVIPVNWSAFITEMDVSATCFACHLHCTSIGNENSVVPAVHALLSIVHTKRKTIQQWKALKCFSVPIPSACFYTQLISALYTHHKQNVLFHHRTRMRAGRTETRLLPWTWALTSLSFPYPPGQFFRADNPIRADSTWQLLLPLC